MKTATVTWITYHNYGTLLQAYALQKKIEQFGHENVILSDHKILADYRSKRQKAGMHMPAIPHKRNIRDIGVRLTDMALHPLQIRRFMLSKIKKEKYGYPYRESLRLCECFKDTELHIIKNVDPEELSGLNGKFDTFIAGSDQIWSAFDDIFNPYYYLDFVTGRKISYAPSLGTDQITKTILEQIKELLLPYEAISVREKISAERLSVLTGRNVEWVADPVLLHDSQFWSMLTEGIAFPQKKYLLCYFLEDKPWYFEYASKIARHLQLKIVLIPNLWEFLRREYVLESGVGPMEFVSLIQHAEYVLTDSYHGSLFSLIFQRDFQYLLRFSDNDSHSQNIRVQSLFNYLEISDRIINRRNTAYSSCRMNYTSINKKIESFRRESEYYLEDALKELLQKE